MRRSRRASSPLQVQRCLDHRNDGAQVHARHAVLPGAAGYARNGVGSERSTLSDLAQASAGFLAPVAQAIRDQVLRESVAHVDETPLPTHDGRRYLWALLGGRQVTFHVGGRGSNELRMILGLPLKDPTPGEQERAAAAYQGRSATRFVNMMADGYSLYDTVLAEAGIGRMNCWAHGLRDLKPFAQEPVIA